MRPRFDQATISRAALEIVDRQGLPSLTMRSLAARLGTGPMTIYNYVTDRDGLESLVVDAVMDEVRIPKASTDWQRDLTAVSMAIWKTVRRHPAAIPVVLTRRTTTASSFKAAEAIVEALVRAGLRDEELLASFRLVMAFVMGIAQAEVAGPLPATRPHTSEAGRISTLLETSAPNLSRLAHTSTRSTPQHDFERGWGIALAGIAGMNL